MENETDQLPVQPEARILSSCRFREISHKAGGGISGRKAAARKTLDRWFASKKKE